MKRSGALRPFRTRSWVVAASLGLLVPAVAWAATFVVMKSPNNGPFDNVLFGADALSTTSAWAVGRADFTTLPVRRPIIERFDGTRWRLLQTPFPAGGGELRDVDTLTSSSAWAVGFENTGGGFNTLTQRWDGRRWSTVTSPNVPGAAQNWLLAQSNVPTLVMKWNGDSWTIEDSPNPSGVRSLWDGTPLGADDLLLVGSSAKIINQNIGPARTLIMRATD